MYTTKVEDHTITLGSALNSLKAPNKSYEDNTQQQFTPAVAPVASAPVVATVPQAATQPVKAEV